MATKRFTVTLGVELAGQARLLDVNIAAAARAGVVAAVSAARSEHDHAAYLRQPEATDSGWADVEAWGAE